MRKIKSFILLVLNFSLSTSCTNVEDYSHVIAIRSRSFLDMSGNCYPLRKSKNKQELKDTIKSAFLAKDINDITINGNIADISVSGANSFKLILFTSHDKCNDGLNELRTNFSVYQNPKKGFGYEGLYLGSSLKEIELLLSNQSIKYVVSEDKRNPERVFIDISNQNSISKAELSFVHGNLSDVYINIAKGYDLADFKKNLDLSDNNIVKILDKHLEKFYKESYLEKCLAYSGGFEASFLKACRLFVKELDESSSIEYIESTNGIPIAVNYESSENRYYRLSKSN